MICSFEERLDELIGMAKELGEAETELSHYEHVRETMSARTSDGARARRHIPTCRRRVEWCSARLAQARARMLTIRDGSTTEASCDRQR